jgi:alanyl aminopeptidase
MLQAARSAGVQDRRSLLEALAEVREPALVEANLALIRSEAFPVVETIPLLIGASYQPANRMRAWAFMTENYDWLAARLPRERVADLMKVGENFCSAPMQRALEAFFRDRSTQLPGGALALTQASERMRLCIAYREVHAPSVARMLREY